MMGRSGTGTGTGTFTGITLLFLGAVFLLPSCKSPPAYVEADNLYFQNRPELMARIYAPAEKDPEVNALVGIDKLLSAAILDGNWGEAERLANLASIRVNVFLAGQEGEQDALGLLGQEKDKPFKGEPHERAMVDFYLGLLRFRRGDYEGALNGFLSAMTKDRGVFLLPVEKSEARKGEQNTRTYLFSDDYALFAFFAAKSCQLIDEPGEAARYLQKAKDIRPELAGLFDRGMDPANNVLVYVESGRAPVKMKTGPRGEILGYRRGLDSTVQQIRIGDQSLSLAMTDDLFVQATTLGGRAVDELNRTKAKRQDALRAAGMIATTAGTIIAASSRNRDARTAGWIVAGIGLATMLFANAAIDPSADIRNWSTLPDRLYLAVGKLDPGSYKAEITARTTAGGDASQHWTDVPISEGTNLLWFRVLDIPRGGVYPGEGRRATTITMDGRPGKES